jgi:hypothetical protein
MTGNPYIFGRLSRFQIKLVTPFAVCPIWCHRVEQHVHHLSRPSSVFGHSPSARPIVHPFYSSLVLRSLRCLYLRMLHPAMTVSLVSYVVVFHLLLPLRWSKIAIPSMNYLKVLLPSWRSLVMPSLTWYGAHKRISSRTFSPIRPVRFSLLLPARVNPWIFPQPGRLW